MMMQVSSVLRCLTKKFFFSAFFVLSLWVVQGSAQDDKSKTADAQNIQTQTTGWRVMCALVTPELDRLNCALTHETFSANQQLRLSSVEIIKGAKGRVMILTTPTGVDLTGGIEISSATLAIKKVNYIGCQGATCFGTIDVTDAMIAAFKRDKTLNISFSDLQGSKLKAEVSLQGFGIALARSE